MIDTAANHALPEAWRAAFRRDAVSKPALADPLPERRLARMLAGYVIAGLIFMVLPGTLLGVWNLLGISSRHAAEAISPAWIQAHGHAQLFGWVATFILGISLYTMPKFRGSLPRSIPLGWAMLGMWSAAIAARWFSGVWAWRWREVFLVSAVLELAVAVLLVWQCSRSGRSHRGGQTWELLVFAGFGGMVLTFVFQLILALRPLPGPFLPAAGGQALISAALWLFCLPVALGFSARFFPGLLGTGPADRRSALACVGLLIAAAAAFGAGGSLVAAFAVLGAVVAGCWALRVFHRGARKPKTNGVDPRYPQFARLAFVWLAISAALGLASGYPGVLGASRHAFTVGFLATLIFSIGPRILPTFLNSRELWSPRLMRASLLLLTAGCALRVGAEPLAYNGIAAAAWRVLPASAIFELAAVLLFALNIAGTLASKVPSWINREQINDRMSVYWLIASFPATRDLLIDSGLSTLGRTRNVPKSLTVREAAEADGAAPQAIVERLHEFFDSRLARTLRAQSPGSRRTQGL